ncbi:hypothetical protein [Candidatus Phyllobacterium onerii]|uniref:hypothetical protein n=1 Tax=Candidatus Phyllobacterium onerii TaxID=3020828 RepID=UPI00232B62EB|nr:hypothetical protein [Phyllobacterium sp. IY22]
MNISIITRNTGIVMIDVITASTNAMIVAAIGTVTTAIMNIGGASVFSVCPQLTIAGH